MKIVFTSGGSGGHIFPIIAIIRSLKRNWPIQRLGPLEVFFLGPKDYFYKKFLEREGIIVKDISAGKIRRYFSLKDFFRNFLDVFYRTPKGMLDSYRFLKKLRPDLIFSKGGYGSLPAIISAHRLKIPIFLHESDSVAGLVNKFSFKYASKIFTSFPEKTLQNSQNQEIIFTGNPLREVILSGEEDMGKKTFGLSEEKPVLLILGGSQGAQRINNVILECLKEILELFEIIHQCGEKNYKEVLTQTNVILEKKGQMKKLYHLYGFIEEDILKHAYRSSHLVISRAGAGVLSEILAIGLPSIIIPLPESAQNHQVKNAYYLKNNGAAIVLEEPNLKPHILMEKLRFLFSKPRLLKEMAQKAKFLGKPEAAKTIAQEIMDHLEKNKSRV